MTVQWNGTEYPYASRRRVVYARNGMVCTGQHLAAQAGLRMLLAGGNAVDAAIATAICLTVVEPNCNGLGSDAFALVWAGGKLYGLNGSGYAPALLTREKVLAAGHKEMPQRGWIPVTIPGAVSAGCLLQNCSNRPSSMPGKDIRYRPPSRNCGRPERTCSHPLREIRLSRAGSTRS